MAGRDFKDIPEELRARALAEQARLQKLGFPIAETRAERARLAAEIARVRAEQAQQPAPVQQVRPAQVVQGQVPQAPARQPVPVQQPVTPAQPASVQQVRLAQAEAARQAAEQRREQEQAAERRRIQEQQVVDLRAQEQVLRTAQAEAIRQRQIQEQQVAAEQQRVQEQRATEQRAQEQAAQRQAEAAARTEADRQAAQAVPAQVVTPAQRAALAAQRRQERLRVQGQADQEQVVAQAEAARPALPDPVQQPESVHPVGQRSGDLSIQAQLLARRARLSRAVQEDLEATLLLVQALEAEEAQSVAQNAENERASLAAVAQLAEDDRVARARVAPFALPPVDNAAVQPVDNGGPIDLFLNSIAQRYTAALRINEGANLLIGGDLELMAFISMYNLVPVVHTIYRGRLGEPIRPGGDRPADIHLLYNGGHYDICDNNGVRTQRIGGAGNCLFLALLEEQRRLGGNPLPSPQALRAAIADHLLANFDDSIRERFQEVIVARPDQLAEALTSFPASALRDEALALRQVRINLQNNMEDLALQQAIEASRIEASRIEASRIDTPRVEVAHLASPAEATRSEAEVGLQLASEGVTMQRLAEMSRYVLANNSLRPDHVAMAERIYRSIPESRRMLSQMMDARGTTLLLWAAQHDQVDFVNVIVNVCTPEERSELLGQIYDGRHTIFSEALRDGRVNAETIQALLRGLSASQVNSFINQLDNEGLTSLDIAVHHHDALVPRLLDLGAITSMELSSFSSHSSGNFMANASSENIEVGEPQSNEEADAMEFMNEMVAFLLAGNGLRPDQIVQAARILRSLSSEQRLQLLSTIINRDTTVLLWAILHNQVDLINVIIDGCTTEERAVLLSQVIDEDDVSVLFYSMLPDVDGNVVNQETIELVLRGLDASQVRGFINRVDHYGSTVLDVARRHSDYGPAIVPRLRELGARASLEIGLRNASNPILFAFNNANQLALDAQHAFNASSLSSLQQGGVGLASSAPVSTFADRLEALVPCGFDMDTIPLEFNCCLMQQVMQDPVYNPAHVLNRQPSEDRAPTDESGRNIFDRTSILETLRQQAQSQRDRGRRVVTTDPYTRDPLNAYELQSAVALRQRIEAFVIAQEALFLSAPNNASRPGNR